MHNTWEWEVFRGDSSSASDLLFTVKRSTLLQLRTEMDVFLAGNTAKQACDFKMKGSYFAFYLGDSDTMIAQVSSTSNNHALVWEFLQNIQIAVNIVTVANLLAVWCCCRLAGSTLPPMCCWERTRSMSRALTMCSSRLLWWFWMRSTAGVETTDDPHTPIPASFHRVRRLSYVLTSCYVQISPNYASEISYWTSFRVCWWCTQYCILTCFSIIEHYPWFEKEIVRKQSTILWLLSEMHMLVWFKLLNSWILLTKKRHVDFSFRYLNTIISNYISPFQDVH